MIELLTLLWLYSFIFVEAFLTDVSAKFLLLSIRYQYNSFRYLKSYSQKAKVMVISLFKCKLLSFKWFSSSTVSKWSVQLSQFHYCWICIPNFKYVVDAFCPPLPTLHPLVAQKMPILNRNNNAHCILF